MLKEFRVSNFKSINSEQIFTMEACSPRVVSEFPDHVIEVGGQRILKVSSIYGPNGCGKTNLLLALITLSNVVRGATINSRARGKDNYMPCRLCGDNFPNTRFDVFFVHDDMEIGYSLVVDLSKIKLVPTIQGVLAPVIDYSIISEELSYRNNTDEEFLTLFKRDNRGIVKSKYLSDIDLLKSNNTLQSSNSFVNYIITTFNGTNITQQLKPIVNFGKEITSIAPLIKETASFIFSKSDVDIFTPHLKRIKELLKGLDIEIKDLKFEEIEPGIYCLMLERETKNGQRFTIQLNCESNGTKKIVNILLDVLSFKGDGIFIADDFDSHLHPKLVRAIIELFTSDNNKNKQLIFNSHDITNMNNQVFRRDEIWFSYRNSEDYSTSYTPLSNIVDYKGNMVRKDAVYSKQYLEGKYGADPFIQKGLEWNK